MYKTVYLLIQHFSNEAVGTFDTTVAVFEDETEAGLEAIAKNETNDDHDVEYFAEPMQMKLAER